MTTRERLDSLTHVLDELRAVLILRDKAREGFRPEAAALQDEVVRLATEAQAVAVRLAAAEAQEGTLDV